MKKQAVVLIHGIGEQMPMSTVRGFVKAILGEKGVHGPAYWSKPDRISELFELRRLQSREPRTSTHFFEYYWAYNLTGTNIWDLVDWLFRMVIRPGKDIPGSARSLWLVSRALLVASGASLVLGYGAIWSNWLTSLASIGIASSLVTGILLVIQYFLVYYLGDAARYLSTRPRNIKLRQKIRSEGIKLLRKLHKSGEYDRIIVVGHSLGCVIGYDIITHLWQDYHTSVPWNDLTEQRKAEIRDCMKSSTSVQPAIREKLSHAAAQLKPNGDGVDWFHECQLEAWHEERHFGGQWRITDFVTLGNPLVHSPLLMASSMQDFKDRTEERELPTCPPDSDKQGFAYSAPQSCDVGEGKKFTPLILHHAAPFAVTRWTNLYFPAAIGIFGDFVGGPLHSVLGLGIKDIAVTTKCWRGFIRHTLLAHLCYWRAEDADVPDSTSMNGLLPSLHALRQALDMSHIRDYRPKEDIDYRHETTGEANSIGKADGRTASVPGIEPINNHDVKLAPETETVGSGDSHPS